MRSALKCLSGTFESERHKYFGRDGVILCPRGATKKGDWIRSGSTKATSFSLGIIWFVREIVPKIVLIQVSEIS